MLLSGAFKSRSISCNKSNFRAGHGPGPTVVVKRPRASSDRQLANARPPPGSTVTAPANPPLTRQTASRSAEITAI